MKNSFSVSQSNFSLTLMYTNTVKSFYAECSHIEGVEFSMYSDWLSATANWQNNNFSHKQRGNCLSCPVTRINIQLYTYLHICVLYMDYGFYAGRLVALCLTPRHLPFSQWCHIYSIFSPALYSPYYIPVWWNWWCSYVTVYPETHTRQNWMFFKAFPS